MMHRSSCVRWLWTTCAIFALFGSHQSHAGIIVTGDVAAGTGVLSITEELGFSITADGRLNLLVLEGWATTLSGDRFLFTDPFNAPVALEVNGSLVSVDLIFLGYGFPNRFIEASDVLFRFANFPTFLTGDSVTILAQDIALAASQTVNPEYQ